MFHGQEILYYRIFHIHFGAIYRFQVICHHKIHDYLEYRPSVETENYTVLQNFYIFSFNALPKFYWPVNKLVAIFHFMAMNHVSSTNLSSSLV
mgnify:CR=1 FL=1